MSDVDRVAALISECMDRCRNSGFALASLVHFLDELRATGHPPADIQLVDRSMRQILAQMNPLPESQSSGSEAT